VLVEVILDTHTLCRALGESMRAVPGAAECLYSAIEGMLARYGDVRARFQKRDLCVWHWGWVFAAPVSNLADMVRVAFGNAPVVAFRVHADCGIEQLASRLERDGYTLSFKERCDERGNLDRVAGPR